MRNKRTISVQILFAFALLFVLVAAGCQSGLSGDGYSAVSPTPASVSTLPATKTPDGQQISQYLTRQANATPIPTQTDFPGFDLTKTAVANDLNEVKFVVTDPASFKIKSGKYQLVEIMAFWCEECRDLNPILGGLQEKWGEKIDFSYLDVDDPLNAINLQALSRLNVVPQVILLDGKGTIIKQWAGPPTADELTAAFEKLPE